MVGIVAFSLFAGAVAFSNVWVDRQVPALRAALPLGHLQNCASLRRDFSAVGAFPLVDARPSSPASAVIQCMVLAASAATCRRAGRLVAQTSKLQASGADGAKKKQEQWGRALSALPAVRQPRHTALRVAVDSISMGAATPASVLSGSRLTYFGIPGRAEAIRLALAYGGVDFEDKRVPFPAWGKVKPTTPWGTVPVLQLADGSELAQARSILRFVGRHAGLYPADPLAAQRVDELLDALEDLGAVVTKVGQDLPKEEQEAARLAAVSKGGAVYTFLAKIDGFIEAHGSGGHAVGAEMSIASILTFTAMGRLVGGVYFGIPPTACDPFANIQAVRKTVGGHPAVVGWYEARIAQQKSLSPAEQVLAGCRDM